MPGPPRLTFARAPKEAKGCPRSTDLEDRRGVRGGRFIRDSVRGHSGTLAQASVVDSLSPSALRT